MDPTKLQALLHLKTNFEAYAQHCVKIRTREALEPLILNPVQRRLNDIVAKQYQDTGKVRVIILKGRQQGISTYVSAYLYWRASLSYAKKGLVVAHKAASTKTLFDMYKRIHSGMQPEMKPSTKYLSATDLTFDQLDSGIKVETASGHGIGRGETLNYVHVSEMGYWDSQTGHSNWGGLKAAVPDVRETAVFIESTAQGMNNVFYDLWRASVRGETEFLPFFSPWFDSPYDVRDVPVDFERTLEEDDLSKTYNLSDAQLQFRRLTIADNSKNGKSGREFFEQEFPSYAEEAFKSSGRPVFDSRKLHELRQQTQPLIRTMAVENGALVPSPIGALRIYREHERGEIYSIGADVAHGQREGDYSVVQVLDGARRQVAMWRGHINPYDFADVLEVLGKYYNNALVAVENNDAGLLTCTRLGRDLRYLNTYKDVREGNVHDVETVKYGFRTTEQTKPMIIDGLRHTLSCNDIEINDPSTLSELETYIFTEGGKMQAAGKAHDDCVMSLSIANHVWRRRWSPINVTDDFYVDAI